MSNHPRVVRIDDVVLGVLEDPSEAANLFDGTTLPQVGVRLQHLAGPASNTTRPGLGQALQNQFAGSHHVEILGSVHPLQHPDGAGGHLQLLTPRGTAQQHRRVSPRPVKFPGRPLPFRETATLQFNDQLARRTGRRQNRPGQRRRWRGSDALDGTGQQDHRQQHNPQAPPPHRLPLLLAAAHCAAKPRPIAMPVGELARLSGSPPTDPVA